MTYEQYKESYDAIMKQQQRIHNLVYNQALEDFFNECLEENLQFYLNPIDCMNKVREQLKR